MNDERWRDSYDSWVTSRSHGRSAMCEQCGGWLTHSRRWGWTCEECSPRDPDAEREARAKIGARHDARLSNAFQAVPGMQRRGRVPHVRSLLVGRGRRQYANRNAPGADRRRT